MKKVILGIFALMISVVCFIACDKDDEPKHNVYSYIEGIFSIQGSNTLTGTVNGTEIISDEAKVSFIFQDEEKTEAVLTLMNIVPGVQSVSFSKVTLSTDSDKYMFSSSTTVNSSTISIEGTIGANSYRPNMEISVTVQ